MVLRRTYDSVVVLKRTFYSSGPEKDLLEVGAESLLLFFALVTVSICKKVKAAYFQKG